jgi:hypothetical protein
MAKIDKKAWIAQAQAAGTIYPVKKGWRKTQMFAAILMCLLIIGIPFGIWMIFRIRKAHAGVTPEGFYMHLYGTNAVRWEDVEDMRMGQFRVHVQGGGLVGALAGAAVAHAVEKRTLGLKGPIEYKLKGKRMWRMFPANMVENSADLGLLAEQRTGARFVPDDLRPEGELVEIVG